MTVRPGADWGTGATRPSSPVVVRSDAALAAALGAGGEPVPLLRGGDLHRTLGAPAGSN
jgi:hypothetical protein